MKISPINFGTNSANIGFSANISEDMEKNHIISNEEFVPSTVRYNPLSDMEFSIIADTIRSQNLRNQMNVRLMHLRRNLNRFMAQDTYK